jgi:cyclopropane-fatty-acyl-phospholipid synthase
MIALLLHGVLRRLIRVGTLRLIWPDGRMVTYRGGEGPDAGMQLASPATLCRLLLHPGLAFGEAYMDGALLPIGCSLYELVDLLTRNMAVAGDPAVMRLRTLLGVRARRLAQRNRAGRARRNVAHHYDLDGRLHRLFLDADQHYSCAYFPAGVDSLEAAQRAKKRHIAARLLLDRPGLSVLDIGCGWGGMALTLARDYRARVTGITLSAEQLEAARARAAAEGLAGQVDFQLRDYRAEAGRYDRIVSVGMFEHVGIGHYRAFFGMLRRCLAPDGVALVHSIGRSDGPGCTSAWLAKYIFPGGYAPALSEVMPAVERAGLVATDIEVLRLHYARTLAEWRRRFAARRAEVVALYDERFCRRFELYLTGSELAFRNGGMVNFQIQLARDQAAVPLTRDYIGEAEAAGRPAGRVEAAAA